MSLGNGTGETALADPPRLNGASERQVSLIEVANVLLRERWLVIASAVVLGGFVAISGFLSPRSYSAVASFIVQKRDQNNAATTLASQLGMDLNSADASQSPAFYSALIKTPDVLGRLADTTFRTSASLRNRSLADIWEIPPLTPDLRRDAVIRTLQQVVTSSPSLKLDLVELKVSTGDPLLSMELADALLHEVNWFNMRTRQSRAAAERQFDEKRVAEVGGELRQAEDETQRFLQSNQQLHMSADLEMQKQRLNRTLEILNARYLALVTAYDRARIDEIRDTPVITVIQQPRLPLRPDPRGIIRHTLLFLILGLALGAFLAILRQAVRNIRGSGAHDAKEFHQLLFDTSHDFSRVWKGVRYFPKELRRLRLKRG